MESNPYENERVSLIWRVVAYEYCSYGITRHVGTIHNCRKVCKQIDTI